MGDYWFLQQLRREQEERKAKSKAIQEETLRLAEERAILDYELERSHEKYVYENETYYQQHTTVGSNVIFHQEDDDTIVLCYEEEFDEEGNICYPIAMGTRFKISEAESNEYFCGINLDLMKEIYCCFQDHMYDNHNGSIIKFSLDDFLFFMREELMKCSSHIEYHGAFAYNY